jgi:hypothetical protein
MSWISLLCADHFDGAVKKMIAQRSEIADFTPLDDVQRQGIE